MKGRIIVIEGACDGIGKSTQYGLLKEELEKDNRVVTHHFPTYNSYQGKGVEEYLSGNLGEISSLSPFLVNNLYANDRAITWLKELKEEYENGSVILLDRYTTSSLIYQSALIEDEEEKKKFIDYVIDYEYNKLGIGKPNTVLFLWAPFDMVTELRNQRKENDGISNDIHERNIEFMKKVYESAMFVSDYLNWEKIDCTNDGKFDSIEGIHKKISLVVNKK